MTQEEKAKAYDKALKKAKDTLQKSSAKDVAETVVYHFFPELKESNDEKIIKAIAYAIGQSTHNDGTLIDGVLSETALDWLRMLENFQSKYPGFYFYDGEKLHFEGNPAIEGHPYDFAISQAINQQGKQKDKFASETMAMKDEIDEGFTKFMEKAQKPVEYSDNFEENIRKLLYDKLTWHSEDGSISSTVLIDDKTFKDIISSIWFYVEKELKQKLSKEDGFIFDTIQIALDTSKAISRKAYLKATDWLKAYGLQPQRYNIYYDVIHSILAMLKGKDFMQITPEHRVSLLNDIRVKCTHADEWAKILDEPRWKPTEEQMRVFSKATPVNLMPEELSVYHSLYEELKKL